MRNIVVVVAGLSVFILLSGAVSAQTKDQAMTVFLCARAVTDVATVDRETEAQLKAAVRAAEKQFKELAKILTTQYGKEREAWSSEVQDRYLDAQEVLTRANADLLYRAVTQDGLTDSVEDIRQGLAGRGLASKKENITVVDAAADAQLIVEVAGRRSVAGTGFGVAALLNKTFLMMLTIKAGPRLSAEQFGAVPSSYRFGGFGKPVWRLARSRPEKPEWWFEAAGSGRWSMAAHNAGLLIEDFVAKNYNRMMTASITQ
jgi:hypothetical protein